MIKWHRVGEDGSNDQVIVDVRDDYDQAFAWAAVTADGRFVVSIVNGTNRQNRLWVFRVAADEQGRTTLSEPIKIVDELIAEFDVVRSDGDRLILRTDLDAGRGRVVALDVAEFERTGEAIFTEIISESTDTTVAVVAAGEELIAERLVDASPQLLRFALDGTPLGRVEVTGGGVLALWARPDQYAWFVGLSTMVSPLRAYRVEVGSDRAEPLDDLVPPAAFGEFDLPEIDVQRHRAVSSDGTQVPYFLIRPTGANGPVPTVLYGYGGFSIPIGADYRAIWPSWLSAGGAVAIANLRGGGEFGTDWYDGGRRAQKQNVFDDFAAVANDLVARRATEHDQLVLHGGSNGGLLVGATITQHPELAAVALPAVGVMDLLRFHLFTAGAAWTSDYGDPEDSDDFEVALAYSPLHNVRPASYPATLITTGDHDDRVVPAHSHKFTATLQQAQRGPAPILTRIETRAGHGAGKPTALVIAELTDQLAFAAHYTGL